MRFKRLISYSLVILLLFSLMSAGVIFAGSEDCQQRLDELNAQIDSLQKQLKDGKTEEKSLNSQISNLDKLIEKAEKEIAKINNEISATMKKISTTTAELEEKQEEIDQQNDEMSNRIRAMYKNGDIGIIEVLLGSENITDFMTNLDMAQKIFDNDVKLLEKLEEQHRIIDGYRKELEALKQHLTAKKNEQAGRQQELEVSRGSVAKLKAEVANNNKVLEGQIDSLNQEANALIAEILRLQGTEDYVGGIMAWPVPSSKRITSYFGYRLHPILKVKKLHTGLDIGVPTGHEIVAANAGKVIKAAWNNSYGYMIMIDHGGGIVTLYAHNSKLKVNTGDIVTRGQVIALAGSTGMSTGPHLHFEVRVNGEYKNPLDYL
ncbi:MAG: peptidoglycan DD-metalloendopeptidase family protein [Clostridiales bacterium]|jgi:murein DD-endopeptidase MepM/ murein hydrolase activator NlpD|nr:peptidoglycan DD-metalloendopeptidase family protein [Clostridiales bacterium]